MHFRTKPQSFRWSKKSNAQIRKMKIGVIEYSLFKDKITGNHFLKKTFIDWMTTIRHLTLKAKHRATVRHTSFLHLLSLYSTHLPQYLSKTWPWRQWLRAYQIWVKQFKSHKELPSGSYLIWAIILTLLKRNNVIGEWVGSEK